MTKWMDSLKYKNESKYIHFSTRTLNQSWIRKGFNFHNHLVFLSHLIMPKVNNKLFQLQWELENTAFNQYVCRIICYLYIYLAIQPTFTEHLSYGSH